VGANLLDAALLCLVVAFLLTNQSLSLLLLQLRDCPEIYALNGLKALEVGSSKYDISTGPSIEENN